MLKSKAYHVSPSTFLLSSKSFKCASLTNFMISCRYDSYCKAGNIAVDTTFSVFWYCLSAASHIVTAAHDRSRGCCHFGPNQFNSIIRLTSTTAKRSGFSMAAVHSIASLILFCLRFPEMKGRGVWLVDMIGSELIRYLLKYTFTHRF